MKISLVFRVQFALAFLAAQLIASERAFVYAPAPADNPLKGFVPYAGQARAFPHSMEFGYLSLNALMRGVDDFTWEPLEKLLNDVASRGCQTVFRIYLEYPRKPTGIPQFLIAGGLKTFTYTNSNTQPLPPALVTTPDYNDPKLRGALTNFIHALGRKYDGDPRIAGITAGLLGTWGEWHTYPRTDLWAGKETQRAVMDAYESAFRKTPVLLRYPAGESDPLYAANSERRLGYHDDSFAWATLATGRKSDSWFFMASMEKAGTGALNKWRTQPIGGEVRPEVWPCLWSENGCGNKGQDFVRCVEETHATWLMDSSINRKLRDDERARAIRGAQRLGYEFHVRSASIDVARDGTLTVNASLTNSGVAPFYVEWPIELGLLDATNRVEQSWRTDWKLSGLLPHDAERTWKFQTALRRVSGEYRIALRVRTVPGAKPLRFANREQQPDGWMPLGEIFFAAKP